MKNSEISYQTSTDYNRLYELLKLGKIVVGYMAMESENSNEYSTLHNFWYNKEYQYFNLNGNLYERYFDKIKFIEYCQKWNVRFIDIPNDEVKNGFKNIYNKLVKDTEGLTERIAKLKNENLIENSTTIFELQCFNIYLVQLLISNDFMILENFFNSAKIGDIMPK